jgi:hypothetical protein
LSDGPVDGISDTAVEGSAAIKTPQSGRFPVSVIVERKSLHDKPWLSDSWQVIGVVGGERATEVQEPTLIRDTGDTSQYLHTGLYVELYKDDLESYCSNLRGRKPGIFVICNYQEDSGDLYPLVVTLSYDEMASYIEVDEPVFDLPIPGDIYRWLEDYVLQNYEFKEKNKRRREKWADESFKPVRRPLSNPGRNNSR